MTLKISNNFVVIIYLNIHINCLQLNWKYQLTVGSVTHVCMIFVKSLHMSKTHLEHGQIIEIWPNSMCALDMFDKGRGQWATFCNFWSHPSGQSLLMYLTNWWWIILCYEVTITLYNIYKSSAKKLD